MSSDAQMTVAALIVSRICHDLISPIGAINNGLELLGMTGTHEGPEMDLISQSVGNASARIRFFRIAFGAAGVQGIGRNEVEAILADTYGTSRFDIAYGPTDPQPRIDVRMVFLGILCLESSLPYGGRIEISRKRDAWTLTGHGTRLHADADLWDVLRTGVATKPLAPAHVQFLLLPLIAADCARDVVTDITEARLIVTF